MTGFVCFFTIITSSDTRRLKLLIFKKCLNNFTSSSTPWISLCFCLQWRKMQCRNWWAMTRAVLHEFIYCMVVSCQTYYKVVLKYDLWASWGGKRHFKVWGTACYHHSHPCKQVQRPPWQSQRVCLCMCECVWRSTIYPVGIGKVDQCMFFSSFTHLPTVTTTTPLTPEVQTPTHAHQGCKSLPQGAQGPHWTPRVGSVPEKISPQSHRSQQGRTLVLSLPWTHKSSHTWKETLVNTNYFRASHNKNCLVINRLWLQGISPSPSPSLWCHKGLVL